MGFLRRRRASGPSTCATCCATSGDATRSCAGCVVSTQSALDRLVERIERDLGEHATRDALLEHAARLHYDAAARAEARARRAEPPRPDFEDARERAVASIFERRYGVPLADALETGLPIPVEPEAGHQRVERMLLRAGLALAVVDEGHWLYEASTTVVYLRHYARERALDLYAPVHPYRDRPALARTPSRPTCAPTAAPSAAPSGASAPSSARAITSAPAPGCPPPS